jgi:hypothetical protein
MEIRFISTLTPDDEENLAPALLRAASALLDETGIAYTLRIETTSEKVFQHNHPAVPATPSEQAGPRRFLDAALLRPIPTTES